MSFTIESASPRRRGKQMGDDLSGDCQIALERGFPAEHVGAIVDEVFLDPRPATSTTSTRRRSTSAEAMAIRHGMRRVGDELVEATTFVRSAGLSCS